MHKMKNQFYGSHKDDFNHWITTTVRNIKEQKPATQTHKHENLFKKARPVHMVIVVCSTCVLLKKKYKKIRAKSNNVHD